MPKYRIQPGGSFRLPDGSTASAGEFIDLPEDVATMHAHILQRQPDAPADQAGQADQADPA